MTELNDVTLTDNINTVLGNAANISSVSLDSGISTSLSGRDVQFGAYTVDYLGRKVLASKLVTFSNNSSPIVYIDAAYFVSNTQDFTLTPRVTPSECSGAKTQ
ncbi:MAG: hypothetical protein COA94_08800 [Rickettsiales bacterium]|nr:MAG: hypothetical protein COA94_08800 [Rickettsiales bacterium]